jgi:hypothetical protein
MLTWLSAGTDCLLEWNLISRAQLRWRVMVSESKLTCCALMVATTHVNQRFTWLPHGAIQERSTVLSWRLIDAKEARPGQPKVLEDDWPEGGTRLPSPWTSPLHPYAPLAYRPRLRRSRSGFKVLRTLKFIYIPVPTRSCSPGTTEGRVKAM